MQNPQINYDGFAKPAKNFPTEEIFFTSTVDGSQQPARVHLLPGSSPRPLLVMLHTWSSDYRQQIAPAVESWCIANDWQLAIPDFRGPSWNPQSCGSQTAVQDVLDCIDYTKQNGAVQEDKIFLTGLSGGGHFSLLLAGKHPKIWAGVSAWVPIFDLASWHADSQKRQNNYDRHIEMACGGTPGSSPEVDKELQLRSPAHWLKPGIDCVLDINAGIQDGHTGSVPIAHSLNAFNAVAMSPNDKIADSDIATMTNQKVIPAHLQQTWDDPSYGDKKVLFRKTSGKARVTIFAGGHEGVPQAIIAFLQQQDAKR